MECSMQCRIEHLFRYPVEWFSTRCIKARLKSSIECSIECSIEWQKVSHPKRGSGTLMASKLGGASRMAGGLMRALIDTDVEQPSATPLFLRITKSRQSRDRCKRPGASFPHFCTYAYMHAHTHVPHAVLDDRQDCPDCVTRMASRRVV